MHCTSCKRPQKIVIYIASDSSVEDNVTIICDRCIRLLELIGFQSGLDDEDPRGYEAYHMNQYWNDLTRFVSDVTNNYSKLLASGEVVDMPITWDVSKFRIRSEQQRDKLQRREKIFDIALEMCYNGLTEEARQEKIAIIGKLYNNADY